MYSEMKAGVDTMDQWPETTVANGKHEGGLL